MNDDELLTMVREQRTKVPMTVPVEQVIRRGHALRARRRIPGLTGALAVAAAAVLSVTALSAHHASHQPGVQLAAWTVAKRADGTVSVTVRELRDPAGLQRKLRADGIPARVIFDPKDLRPNLCIGYIGKVHVTPGMDPAALFRQVITRPMTRGLPQVIVIHPSALPRGAGVQIIIYPHHTTGISLVAASQRCTGS